MFLDPKFFDKDNKLHTAVRQVLLDVANDVLMDLKDKATFSPAFIVLTGSMTGLNWDDESDLDLHIGVDFSSFPEDEVGLYKNLLAYYARNFNANKYTLKGRNIELYFQDSKEKHESPGIYNLVQDFWIKTPDQTVAHFNSRVKEAAGKYLSEVGVLIFEWEEVPRNREAIKQFLDKVNTYMKQVVEMRKQSLLHDGMSGFGNQVFRELRRNGVLPKLSDLRKEAQDAYYDVYEERDKMSKAKALITMFEERNYHLDNNVGLDPSYKSWRDFLDDHVKEGGKVEERDGWKHYIYANQHWIVDPEGNIYSYIGYHGSNAWKEIKEDPDQWLAKRSKYQKDLKGLLSM